MQSWVSVATYRLESFPALWHIPPDLSQSQSRWFGSGRRLQNMVVKPYPDLIIELSR
jgi:hypothetical protein